MRGRAIYRGWWAAFLWGYVQALQAGFVGVVLAIGLMALGLFPVAFVVMSIGAGWGLWRGLNVRVEVSPEKIWVHNPWRTHRFEWSDVEGIEELGRPSLSRGGFRCPALRIRDRRSRVALCGMVAWERGIFQGRASATAIRVAWLIHRWATENDIRVPGLADIRDAHAPPIDIG